VILATFPEFLSTSPVDLLWTALLAKDLFFLKSSTLLFKNLLTEAIFFLKMKMTSSIVALSWVLLEVSLA